MKHLRDLGYIVARVEQRIPKVYITKDAFGFGDLLATDGRPQNNRLIQVTTTNHLSAREKKIRETEEIWNAAQLWMLSNGRIFLHGWAKKGPRGERKRWTLTEREIIE